VNILARAIVYELFTTIYTTGVLLVLIKVLMVMLRHSTIAHSGSR